MARQKYALSTIVNPRVLSARLELLTDGLEVFKHYSQFIKMAQECEPDSRLHAYAVREARDAERWLRRGLHVGLDSLNELTDSGAMEAFFAGATETFVPAERFASTLDTVDPKILGLHASAFREAMNLLKRYVPQARISNGTLEFTFRGEDGKETETRFQVVSAAGSMARVSPEIFFSPISSGSIVFQPLPIDDCHHKRVPLPIPPIPHKLPDLYGAMVATMAYARERMYEHVREVEDIGFPQLSGGAGGDLVAIILGVVLFLILSFTTAAIVLEVACEQGDQSKCTLAKVFGIVATALTLIGGFLFIANGKGPWQDGSLFGLGSGEMNLSVN